ncbi:hypothetical protein [Nitratireductor basaltis]|uniref:Uncharacterized protein n=1 Tax=Nitratireductor basaltis TaxID=472175 RepID=A0A084UDH9_9HYPH|nr:hypothetical protein [Nitratireductor basaltis]KFB11015.1 hypothetical protein EL18_02057 [Nitratireductor basaltis]
MADEVKHLELHQPIYVGKTPTGNLRWYKGELQQEFRVTYIQPNSHHPNSYSGRSEWEAVPTVEDDDAAD